VVDFRAGGYQMLLRGEPMPARFSNRFEKTPTAQAERADESSVSSCPASRTRSKKGHRIMVQIQSTWFPLVARNPQKYMTNYKQATAADFQKATQKIYFGGANASAIVLPIVKK
jgi:predicted acyl esterase